MSNAVKKAYQDIVNYLEANKDKKVSTVLPEVINLCAPKSKGATGARTFIKSPEGDVLAIFDYYFKRWMPLVGAKAVEFGAKAGSPTGLSNMSKLGTSLWTKQQRESRKATGELINEISAGTLKPENIPAKQFAIEAARNTVAETDMGFEKYEDLVAYLESEGFEVPAESPAKSKS